MRFFLGEKLGAIKKIVYEGTGQNKKSIGIRTKAGRFYAAKLVVVAVGAAAEGEGCEMYRFGARYRLNRCSPRRVNC